MMSVLQAGLVELAGNASQRHVGKHHAPNTKPTKAWKVTLPSDPRDSRGNKYPLDGSHSIPCSLQHDIISNTPSSWT